MKYQLRHTTTYNYTGMVSACQNEARLKPINTFSQDCVNSQLIIEPAPSDYSERTDFFGNKVCYFAIQQPHTKLTVTAVSEVHTRVEQRDYDKTDGILCKDVATHLRSGIDAETLNARQYVLNSPMVSAERELEEYARRSLAGDRPIIEAVYDVMEKIHRDFTYDPGFTTLATPLQEVLKHRRGVCQDFAHLAIGCIRSQGLAARYASGYIETQPPPGQPKLIGADASHAWFSVYIPELGWVDFDPTNNQMPMDKHVTVAIGRDYSDVTPLKGVIFGGGKHKLDVAVDMTNLDA
jgi:transglutaminase-like putative cysteine protease